MEAVFKEWVRLFGGVPRLLPASQLASNVGLASEGASRAHDPGCHLPMDDLTRFCCQNPDCPLYGRRDAGNLSVRDRYGKYKPIRLLTCHVCKARFSERTGTALFHSC